MDLKSILGPTDISDPVKDIKFALQIMSHGAGFSIESFGSMMARTQIAITRSWLAI